MGWPDIDLPVEVLAAFGADLTANPRTWSWTDLTGRLRGPIRVRAGRSEGASKTSPASATLLLDNEDGALTPDHPMSPFWPHVDMSTPVWLRLRPELLDEPTVADAFDRVAAGGWGSADTGGVWTRTGAGGTVDDADWAVNGSQATHSVPTAAAYRHSTLLGVELADVQATTTVTLPATPTGGPIEAGLMLRVQTVNSYYLFRAEVQPSGAVVARIYGSALLASATVPGLTYTAGRQLRIRAQAVGRTLAMRVWSADAPEPAVWHVEADDAAITEPGGVGIYSGVAAGNTNTKPVVVAYDHFEARPYWELLTGYADQWEPQYVPTGDGVTSMVRLTLSGVLRRLEQGASPVRSPLYRAYATADPQPIAWWPLEDGPAVDRAASGLPDGQPVAELGKPPGTQIGSGNYPGTIVWGVRGSGGAASLVSLSLGGRLSATFPASSASSWTFEFVVRHDAGSNPNGFATVPVYLRYRDQWEWALRFDPNGAVDFAGGTITGEVGVLMTAPFSAWDGYLHHIRIDVEQVGADAAHYLWIDGELLASAYWFGHTVVVPTSVRVEHSGGGPHEPSIGHLALFAPRAPYDQVRPSAARAWLGEPAAARIARLCAEEGIRFRGDGVLAKSTPMGPQGTAPVMELIRECEAADGGLLGETDWGLSYRPRTARYNLSPTLVMDMAAYRYSEGTNPSTVLAPRLDDAATRNEWTVSRPQGSSVTVADLGHQQRVGRYDDSVELNVLSDQDLRDHAGWRVHLGTHSTRRYPALPLDLAANPELVADWLRLRLGDRVTLTGLPAQHPPGPVDLVVEGWSAQLGARQWQVTLVGAPYAPWRVATAGGPQRVPTEGSTLAAPLAAGAMTASLAYTGTRWVTDSAHFPLRLRIGGEEVEVSAISGTSSPQTATISARGLNGITRSWPAGTPVQVSDPAIAPL